MCDAFSDFDWSSNPKWANILDRQANMAEIAAEVEEGLKTLSMEDVVARMRDVAMEEQACSDQSDRLINRARHYVFIIQSRHRRCRLPLPGAVISA